MIGFRPSDKRESDVSPCLFKPGGTALTGLMVRLIFVMRERMVVLLLFNPERFLLNDHKAKTS